MHNTEKLCEAYPYFGVGPHVHVGLTSDPSSIIGSTRMLPREEWPDNFEECPAEGWAGLGMWYCPHDCECSACPDGLVAGEGGLYWFPEQEPDDEDDDEGPPPEEGFAGTGVVSVVEI